MIWGCITPERVEKTKRIMDALSRGWPGLRVCRGAPPNVSDPFITWGQIWLADTLIREALPLQRRFFQIDNGCYKSARGTVNGYYRFMYARPNPVFLTDAAVRSSRRIAPAYKPWRKIGSHIVIAEPGPDFGRAFGIDSAGWLARTEPIIRASTDRPIVVRSRFAPHPLAKDLAGAWALITHSSNVAVDAVLAGIPVFVEATSMALPVGRLIPHDIEDPALPDREDWWASLMCQQFTLAEMANGVAYNYLSAVQKQVELDRTYWTV